MMNKLNGNTDGIRNSVLEQIRTLYDFELGADEFASFELLNALAAYTGEIRREISVYLSRDGRVMDVTIGDSGKVSMPNMRLVRNSDRLCGVRCIHTHPNGDGRLSSVDIGTLRSMRLDSMAALGVGEGGKPASLYAAYLGDMAEDGEEQQVQIYGPLRPSKLPGRAMMQEIFLADERLRSTTQAVHEAEPERAVLAGIENNERYDTLAELAELAATAGAQVVGQFVQRKRDVDNATYIGSGKAEELSLAASALQADLFIFDDELTAMQMRNLESILGVRVIDRTALILDIFAKRAQSREGKLQVELAQLKYELPRIFGQGKVLSRQGAGAIARGPGETKLESDKRRIRRRIFELGEELKEVEKQRALRRERREKDALPLIALVGYTNVGKSTLLNALTDAGVMAEDKLFATLDPVVRKLALPGGTQALLSDTVGFINKLPHDLIEAFQSTLDEVRYAELILHVVDVSSSYYESQMAVVEDVIARLGAGDVPRIVVYNKADKADASPPPGGMAISARTGQGLPELLAAMEKTLSQELAAVELLIPYEKYEAMALLQREGRILREEHEENGTRVKAQMPQSTFWRLKKALGMDDGNAREET
ncbi:MAG: GTPase HflX [Christensenellaceae bacterium]|jgi:GTP-binding protein HflX|nr:GTPase HflX [Christensenellaceae bacterium]